MNKKRLIIWQPNNDGKGSWLTRVSEETPNAKKFEGTTTSGKDYKYFGLTTNNVSGVLKWIDKIEGKFSTSIILILETEKGLHKIELPHNINFLGDVVYPLKKLGKDVIGKNLSFNYAVMDKKDKDGNFVLNEKKEVKKVRKVFIRDENDKVLPMFFNQESNPKPKDLDWVEKKTPKGKEWDNSKEIIFLENTIVAIQEFLLKNDSAIPLSYGSLLCPSTELGYEGGKIISQEFLIKAQEVYKQISGSIIFPYATKGSSSNADDVFDAIENAGSTPASSSSDSFTALTEDNDPFEGFGDTPSDDDLNLPF